MLIVGDLIVDETWYVDARKLSPEAPVPVGYLTSPKPELSPGGASLAASYALKQKYPSQFCTMMEHSREEWLQSKGIKTWNLGHAENVVKTRFIDTHSNYHLLRIDNDEVVKFPSFTKDSLEPIIHTMLDNVSCVAMLDYRKGVFSDWDTVHFLIQECIKRGIPTYVDTRCDPSKFRMTTYLKLNEKEYVEASASLNINSPSSLCRKLNIPNILITLGKNGAQLFTSEGNSYEYTPSMKKHIGTPDVTGCGDVFDVNFCYYCFQEGLSPTESLRLSVDKATEYAYTSIGDRLC